MVGSAEGRMSRVYARRATPLQVCAGLMAGSQDTREEKFYPTWDFAQGSSSFFGLSLRVLSQ